MGARQHLRDAPQVELLRVEALIGNGHRDLALKVLVKLASQFPDDASIVRKLAAMHLALRQHGKAVAALQQVVALESSDQSSRRLLAQMQKHGPERSVDYLTGGGDDAMDHVSRLRAARLCCQSDRLDEAEVLYRQLLEHHTTDQALWIEAGRLSLVLGDEEIALQRLEKAASIPGRHRLVARVDIAVAHSHSGRFHCAAGAWCSVVRMTPDHADGWAGLIVCAHILGKDRLAKRALGKLKALSSYEERRRLLAAQWIHVGGEHAVQQTCGTNEMINEAAPLVALLQEAGSSLERISDQYPHRADVRYHIAVCHDALGDTSAARQSVGDALKINQHYDAARQLHDRLAQAGASKAA
jgi:tetratricopeptide (TPR) repeat protein